MLNPVFPYCLQLVPTTHSHRTELQTAVNLEGKYYHVGLLSWIVAQRYRSRPVDYVSKKTLERCQRFSLTQDKELSGPLSEALPV